MLSDITIAQLLAALFTYALSSLFCPCVSLLYYMEAASISCSEWNLFYWIAGSGLSIALCLCIKAALNALHERDRNRHLLLRIHSSWIFFLCSCALLLTASLWNGRFLLGIWQSDCGIIAGICLILSLGMVPLKIHNKPNLSYSDYSSALLACAIVLALSPVSLSPLMCLYSCLCLLNQDGFKKLAISHLLLPIILFALSRLIREDSLNVAMFISALIVTALCIYILKLKLELKEYSHRLKFRESEMDMDHRRMDELEMGIVRNERENLLNMLELRRKDLTQAAEKLTSQRLFMQDIYDLLFKAESSSDPAEKDGLLHEMKSKINLRMNFSDERNDFDSQVEELHKDFSIRLENRFPSLTAQEKKLATMLRLDFPTKYIATILNISPKSVEIERHRLRKKFGLDRKTRLTDFVKNI